VEIENEAFISGGVGIHQYSRIGRLAMIGGNSGVNMDVPPFLLCNGDRLTARGLNMVGLRRAGFTRSDIQALKTAYKILYRSGLKQDEALERIESEVPTDHTRHFVQFIRASKRGICGTDHRF
jgi:UDP-N-acetylglucosamine acyltransferase